MAHPVRSLSILALLACAGLAAAQRRGESREPPLADETQVIPAGGKFDPDELPVQRVQNIVPAPAVAPTTLPRAIVDPDVVPAEYARPVVPAGDLPPPVVTLKIEGSEITPSGQPVVYKLILRNVSAAKANNVVLRVIPPKGVERVHVDPAPTADEAEQRWEFKTVEPGQTRTVELSYKPKATAAEVEIQAWVQINFGRGMKTQVAAPTVSVKKEGPDKLVVGETQTYRITVKNTGRVTVNDIEVIDELVKGLAHDDRELSRGTVDGRTVSSVQPNGSERTWSIPALAPGQSKVLEYRIKAREVGKLASTVRVKAQGLGPTQDEFDTEVMIAALKLTVAGPDDGKGTVGQASIYKVVVRNSGSADLKNVVVRALFPPDMRPTRATNQGQSFKDSVQWVFKDLKHGEEKELTLGLTTASPGLRTIQFVAKGDRGPEQRQIVKTEFAGKPNPDWDAVGPGTGSVGKTLKYQVTVSNRGTAAGRYQLSVDLPANVEFVQSDPPAAAVTGKNTRGYRFAAVDVAAGKRTTLTLEVKARSAGEARLIFKLLGDGIDGEPVHDVMTNVVGTDDRGPTPPPPAVKPQNVGAGPGRE